MTAAVDQPRPWENFSDQRKPGDYPLEKLPVGWANARVTLEHKGGEIETRVEIIDLKTGTRYLQEPMPMIALKCAGLFALLLPPYLLIYTLFQIIRTPIATVVNLSLTVFVKQIWSIVRIPFYAAALEFAALYGVFRPLEGRALFGKFQSDFHDGKTRRQAEQHLKKTESDFLWKALSLREPETAFFAGYCMAPIGQRNDAHIKQVQILQPAV